MKNTKTKIDNPNDAIGNIFPDEQSPIIFPTNHHHLNDTITIILNNSNVEVQQQQSPIENSASVFDYDYSEDNKNICPIFE